MYTETQLMYTETPLNGINATQTLVFATLIELMYTETELMYTETPKVK